MQDFLQILALVLGILTSLLGLAKHFGKSSVAEVTKESTAVPKDQAKLHYKQRRREAVDLSFVLICSAFFSLLLTDSLIISGRNPSPGPGTILIVVGITAVVVITMFGAWFLGVAELVTGFLTITTVTVLLLSSGGPFFAAESDAVAGLSLLIPTMLLVALAATMLIYSFGNPLNRSLPKRRRIGVSLILFSILFFASAALGKALVLSVIADPRTPKLGQAQTLFQNLLHVSLQDRRKFYRLASEIALAQTYKRYFRAVSQEQKYIQPDQAKSDGSARQQSSPRLMGSNVPPAKLSGVQPTPAPTPSIVRGASGDLSSDTEISKERGFARANFLISYFYTSQVATQEQYLIDRLAWVHPVGMEGQSVATISLPGSTPDERLEGISYLRAFVALYNQPNFRQSIVKEFEYPEQIRQFFQERDEHGDLRTGIFSGSALRPPTNLYKPTLFPKFEVTINNSQLRQQLSLPLKPEAYVAFKQYTDLALVVVQDEFKSRLPPADFERLTNTFNTLDDQAQDAFLNYVINNRRIPSEQVYQMLMDLKGINFDKFANSQDPIAVEKLISILQGNRMNEKELQDIADQVSHSESRQAKDTFLELLKNENPEFPIKRLFQPQVFELVDQIHKFLGADKREFFNAVADPIWVVAKQIAVADTVRGVPRSQADGFPLDTYLNNFRTLDVQDQSGLLQQLAIILYQSGGPYSLDPIRSLVSQMKSWNDAAGLVCASLLSVPGLVLCLLVGGFFSRKLVARDRKRELVKEELATHPEFSGVFGSPVEVLYGRDEMLRKLRNLAERGWSTIGIVGRRGVGKSRVLDSLFRSESSGGLTPTVTVWVSAPTKFQEEDFVFSIFERLALSTEAKIATYLDASPISIRKIEHRAAVISTLCYVGGLGVLGIIVYEMFNRLTRSDIAVTWLPIVTLVLSGIGVFVFYLSKRQPVDLSSWLQRDRKHNPHTVMLYKEVYEALAVLRDRGRGRSVGMYHLRRDWLRQVAMSGFAMIFSLSIGYIVLSLDNPYSDLSLWLTLLLAGLSCWAWLYLLQRRASADDRMIGQSVMSLIADYRSFATTIVHRLSQGALGHQPDRKFPILICIDELDKIVDVEEIRVFLRKIKAIFEIPGLYYYVSLAEDTLTALYLGSASGKSEIDSAFDHIVSVQPLNCSTGENIASEYLTAHGFTSLPPRLVRIIAAVAFGIPRDIIRRCDELLAQEDRDSIQSSNVPAYIRRKYTQMGYDLQQLSKDQISDLIEAPSRSAKAARSLLSSSSSNSETVQQRLIEQERLILSIWILSLLEIAGTRENDQEWDELSQALSNLGYRLPVDPVEDLRDEIERVHNRLLALESSPTLRSTSP
jgi:cell division protein FtsB